LDCVPVASEIGIYCDAEVCDNPTDGRLTLKDKILSVQSITSPLLRTAYICGDVLPEQNMMWPSDGFALCLPPAVACNFMQTRGNIYRHVAGVCARVSFGERVCIDIEHVLEDADNSNNAASVFRSWRLDAAYSLVEIPDLIWLQYYREDVKRLTEIPLTNWWRVSHVSSNGERQLKTEAMLKSRVFFELLLWTCIERGITQRLFIDALQ